MPLNAPTLAGALAGIFSAKMPTTTPIAAQMANAYTAFALTGLFGAAVPVPTPANTQGLQASLVAALVDPRSGSAARFAQAWSQGLTAFWLSPPVPAIGAQSGLVTAFTGAAALVSSLTAVLSNLAATPQTTAQLMATSLHTASMTVVALLNAPTPPPPVTLPLA